MSEARPNPSDWAARSQIVFGKFFERGSSSPTLWAGGPLSYMFYIYILKSLKDNRTYVGYTNDLERRLSEHNSGKNIATKNRRPLELIFSEQFETSAEAKKRELYWKSGGGRRKLKTLFKDKF